MNLRAEPKCFIILFMMLVACEESPNAKDCTLKTSSITYENGSKEFTSFLYDDKQRLIELTETTIHPGGESTTHLTFLYDDNEHLIEVDFHDGTRVINLYNSNDQRIVRETYFEDLLQSRREYVYNAYGQVTKFTSFNDQFTVTGYELFEYVSASTRNYSLNKIYNQKNTLVGSNEYEYDSKRPSWPDIGLGIYTDNNHTAIIYKEADGSVGTTFSKVYEYSSLGYPTRVTTTYTSGFSKTVGIETLKYVCR